MRKQLSKIVKTGYGLGLLSLGQAKKIAHQVKLDLHLDEKESLKLAHELVATSEKTAKEVLRTVDKHLSKALVKSRLVKKGHLNSAKRRLRKTVKRLYRR